MKDWFRVRNPYKVEIYVMWALFFILPLFGLLIGDPTWRYHDIVSPHDIDVTCCCVCRRFVGGAVFGCGTSVLPCKHIAWTATWLLYLSVLAGC